MPSSGSSISSSSPWFNSLGVVALMKNMMMLISKSITANDFSVAGEVTHSDAVKKYEKHRTDADMQESM